MSFLDTAATHEAGHCYAAWRKGFRLHKVTINSDGATTDGPKSRYWCMAAVTQRAESVKNEPFFTLAGPAAEYLAGNDLREISFHEVAEVLQRTAAYGEPGLKSLVDLAADIEGKSDHLSKLERGEIFFEKMLPEVMGLFSGPGWDCISTLAHVLQDKGTVDGRTAAGLFETIHGGLPEGVLPADSHTKWEPDTLPLGDALDQAAKYMTWAESVLSKVWPEDPTEETIHEKARTIFLQAALQFSDIQTKLQKSLSKPDQAAG